MNGKYTQRINSILKERKLTWKWLSEVTKIKQGTLSYCKTNDNYSSQYIDKIAEALEISVSELTDFNGNYKTMRKLLSKVDMLRQTLSEEMEDVTERLLKNK